MMSITIRRLPEPTKEKLRIQAARAGLSLEGYSRQILQTASEGSSPEQVNLAELSRTCFGPENGIELDLPLRGDNRAPVTFD